MEVIHNPDVLVCLANLSSEEVFTPPIVANQVLDLLPGELWQDPKSTFLDPVTKSGVFLREITRRLLKGLEDEIPDLEDRLNHILLNQVFGISITELTALISRRSLYCSKLANSKYSVCQKFDNEEGNIRFKETDHIWQGTKCKFCNASRRKYERAESLESHAYEFIHVEHPKELFDMEFDVVIGNPPYQLGDGGYGASASPLYHKFVLQAKKLEPRFLSMIIPARWYAGGKGLDNFRVSMLNDSGISRLVDYPDSSDVFPNVSISGGVCYFLWEQNRPNNESGACQVESRLESNVDIVSRPLNEFDTFVRFNKAVSILQKVQRKELPSLAEQISPQKPFGLRTYVQPTQEGNVTLYANKNIGNIDRSEIPKGTEDIDKWKTLISGAHGAGVHGDFPRLIMGPPIVAPPPSVCTETYLVVGAFDSEEEAVNMAVYLKSKFLRFLLSLRKNTQHQSRDKFTFVPQMPMTEKWTDKKLYEHFGLSEEEKAFIENMIKPLE